MKKLILLTLLLGFCNFIQGQTYFENKDFGFIMQNPTNWVIAENNGIIENVNKVRFNQVQLTQLITASKGALLLTSFYKYPFGTRNGLVPTINIKAHKNPTKSYTEFKKYIENGTSQLGKYLENLEFIKAPTEVNISGLKAVEYFCKYTLKTKLGETMKIRTRFYAIPNDDFYFTINFIDGQIEDDCTKEFEDLLKTIKINKT
jgi:hypothetical protein